MSDDSDDDYENRVRRGARDIDIQPFLAGCKAIKNAADRAFAHAEVDRQRTIDFFNEARHNYMVL